MIITWFKIVLVVIAAIPLSIIALFSTPIDTSGKTFHWTARVWSGFILWLFNIRVVSKGTEVIDRSRHYVYISNHASAFDIPAVVVGIPDDIRFVLKKELTRIPIWGWALKYGHYISIDRSNARDAMKSLEEAAQRMRNGASVILFAEGTRTRDGKLQPFKRGAISLAAKAGNPIIPVTINHTFAILPKGSWRVHAADIEIVFGKPIPVDDARDREGEQRLMDRVREAVAQNYIDQG